MKYLIALLVLNVMFSSCDTAKGLPGASTSVHNSIQNKVHVLSYIISSKGQYEIKEAWIEKWWFYGSWGRVNHYMQSPQDGYYQIIIEFNEKVNLKNKTILLGSKKNYFTPLTDERYICSLIDSIILDSLECIIVEGDNFNVLNENRLKLDSFTLTKK